MMVDVPVSLNLLVQTLDYLGLAAPEERQLDKWTRQAYINAPLYKTYKTKYDELYHMLYRENKAIVWQEHQFMKQFELIVQRERNQYLDEGDWVTWQDICYEGDM